MYLTSPALMLAFSQAEMAQTVLPLFPNSQNSGPEQRHQMLVILSIQCH